MQNAATNTAILALAGFPDTVVDPFAVGEPLLRRPHNAAGFNATWTKNRLMLNMSGTIRGAVLDIGTISGPLQKSSCTARGGSTSARQALRCTVSAASVTYPFYGVVTTASGQITYCKKDQAPVAGMNVPLSAKCL